MDGGSEAPKVVTTITRLLAEGDRRVRERAAAAFAKLGPKGTDAIPALIEMLRHAGLDVREQALVGLGGIGPEAGAAVPAILAALDDDTARRLEWVTRKTLLRIVPGAPADAAAALADCALRGPYRIRGTAMDALTVAGPAGAAELARIVRETEGNTASHAIGLLGRMGADGVPSLTEVALRGAPNSYLAVTAIHNTGEAARDAVPLVLRTLDIEHDAAVRRRAPSPSSFASFGKPR